MPLIAVDSDHSLLDPGMARNSQVSVKSTHWQHHNLNQWRVITQEIFAILSVNVLRRPSNDSLCAKSELARFLTQDQGRNARAW